MFRTLTIAAALMVVLTLLVSASQALAGAGLF